MASRDGVLNNPELLEKHGVDVELSPAQVARAQDQLTPAAASVVKRFILENTFDVAGE